MDFITYSYCIITFMMFAKYLWTDKLYFNRTIVNWPRLSTFADCQLTTQEQSFDEEVVFTRLSIDNDRQRLFIVNRKVLTSMSVCQLIYIPKCQYTLFNWQHVSGYWLDSLHFWIVNWQTFLIVNWSFNHFFPTCRLIAITKLLRMYSQH